MNRAVERSPPGHPRLPRDRDATRIGAMGAAGRISMFTAAAVVLGLQALRLFLAQVVWGIGENGSRGQAAAIAAGAVALGLLAAPLRRVAGARGSRGIAALVLAAAVLAAALLRDPGADLRLGALGVAAFGATLVLGVARAGLAGGSGLALGAAADLGIRLALGTVDAPTLGGVSGIGIVAGLAAALVWGAWTPEIEWGGTPSLRRAAPLAGLGPWLFLHLQLTGNPGQLRAALGADESQAALVLAGGALFGVLRALTRFHPAPARAGGQARLAMLLVLAGAAATALGGFFTAAGAFLIAGGAPAALAGVFEREESVPTSLPAGAAVVAGLFLLVALLHRWHAGWQPAWVVPAAAVLVAAAAAAPRWRPAVRTPGYPRGAFFSVAGLAAAFLVSGVVLDRGAPVAVPARLSAPAELTLLTWNIRMGMGTAGRLDLESVAEVLEAHPADLVLLQESGRGWAVAGSVDAHLWLARRLGRPAFFVPYSTDLEGHSVLAGFRARAEALPLDEPDRDPRGAARIAFESPAGPVTVFAVHLDWEPDGGAVRERQMRKILEAWRGAPRTILAGDFNAVPGDPAVRAALAAGFRDLDPSGGPTFPSLAPARRIDHVLATADLEAASAAVIPTTASDHRALEVRIRIK